VLASLSGFVSTTSRGSVGGAVLTLTTTNSQGQTVTFTATTNASGFFQFAGLPPGTFTLTVTPPPGLTNSSDQAGTVNGTPSGTAINLGPGGHRHQFRFSGSISRGRQLIDGRALIVGRGQGRPWGDST
jgi:hypothetical protein